MRSRRTAFLASSGSDLVARALPEGTVRAPIPPPFGRFILKCTLTLELATKAEANTSMSVSLTSSAWNSSVRIHEDRRARLGAGLLLRHTCGGRLFVRGGGVHDRVGSKAGRSAAMGGTLMGVRELRAEHLPEARQLVLVLRDRDDTGVMIGRHAAETEEEPHTDVVSV